MTLKKVGNDKKSNFVDTRNINKAEGVSETNFKGKKYRNNKSGNVEMKEILSDPRFAHVPFDPKYRDAPNKEVKIKIDSRFKSALTKEDFNTVPLLDPRGKPKTSYATKEKLTKFYELPSSDDSDVETQEEPTIQKTRKEKKKNSQTETSNHIKNHSHSLSDEENETDEEIKVQKKKNLKKKSKNLKTKKKTKTISAFDDESEEEDQDDSVQVSRKNKKIEEAETEKIQSQQSTSKEMSDLFTQCLADPERDLARGVTIYSDDSSDDDSSTTDDDEDDEDQFAEFEWGQLDEDAKWDVDGNVVEVTSRFAVCDMDWDQIKAVDLMVLFASFCPAGGSVVKVTIFPSEYGKTRLEEEEAHGPQELVRLVAGKKKGVQDQLGKDLERLEKGTLEESTSATATQIEALRRYQRNRLRYYYAVVACDSAATAEVIYKECDRTHFEVGGVTLDLRYIPEDMDFDEVPHDSCENVPDSYESESFETTALLNAKPTLTWDETDRRRKKVLAKAMAKAGKNGGDLEDQDVENYVACSDDDEEEEEEEDEEEEGEGEDRKEERIAKFRALINEIDEKEKKKKDLVFDMEDTFGGGDGKSEGEGEEEGEGEGEEESSGKGEDRLTPFEQFLVKRKEKKEKKRQDKINKQEVQEEEESGDENKNEMKQNEEDIQNSAKISSKKTKNKRNKNKNKAATEIPTAEVNTDLSLLVMEEERNALKHFDMRKIREEKRKTEEKKKKRKRKEEKEEEKLENGGEDFKVDSSDPRFSSFFAHSGFNLDPSHAKYDPHSTLNTTLAPNKKQKTQQPPKTSTTMKAPLDSDISNLIQKIRSKTSSKIK